MNVTCPNCEMENAYFEVIDQNGAHYRCPDCDYEWVDTSVTEEDADYGEVADEEDEEEDDDSILSQAGTVTHEATGQFLKELITDFEQYRFSEEELVVLAKLYQLVRKPKKYSATGYLYVLVKEVYSEGNHQFQEIQVDDDGLRLACGGYETGPYGGDSVSNTIFPIYDEREAMDIETRVENFIDHFRERLIDGEIEREVFDSGDEIEELQ